MNVAEYNALCRRWHEEETGQRLGQWLMNHYAEIEDREIFYCKDKKEAASLFFGRYVIVSPNGLANKTKRIDATTPNQF